MVDRIMENGYNTYELIVSVQDALRNEGERTPVDAPFRMEEIDYLGRVRFEDGKISGYLFAEGQTIHLIAEITVRCVFECDRCLKEFFQSVTLPVDEVFTHDAEEEDWRIRKNETIDLQPPVEQMVLSSLPIERLCKSDCKGLCPHCGIDKNFSSCSCQSENDDNPFSVLKGLVD